jgi:hypothetical protein
VKPYPRGPCGGGSTTCTGAARRRGRLHPSSAPPQHNNPTSERAAEPPSMINQNKEVDSGLSDLRSPQPHRQQRAREREKKKTRNTPIAVVADKGCNGYAPSGWQQGAHSMPVSHSRLWAERGSSFTGSELHKHIFPFLFVPVVYKPVVGSRRAHHNPPACGDAERERERESERERDLLLILRAGCVCLRTSLTLHRAGPLPPSPSTPPLCQCVPV